MTVRTNTHIDVAGIGVAYLCDHADGSVALDLIGGRVGNTASFHGTPADLLAFAERLRVAAQAAADRQARNAQTPLPEGDAT